MICKRAEFAQIERRALGSLASIMCVPVGGVCQNRDFSTTNILDIDKLYACPYGTASVKLSGLRPCVCLHNVNDNSDDYVPMYYLRPQTSSFKH